MGLQWVSSPLLSNSNWEPYDPSLEDEPEVIALEKIRNSSHLMRFTSRKINKTAGKLIAWQGKIEEKTQPLFDELGIAPSEFTEEVANNIKQSASEVSIEAESALQSFIDQLPTEGDFSIQAEDSISSSIKQKAKAALKKVNQLVTSATNKSSQKYDEAKKALQDLRAAIADSGAPELLAEYDRLITPLEDKLGTIGQYKLASKLRKNIIKLCLPPQKGECGEGGVPLSNILANIVMDEPTQTKKEKVVIQRRRVGSFEDAKNEFKKLIGDKCIVELKPVPPPKVVNTVNLENHPTLPKGTQVIVRNTSRGDIPTLEVQIPSVNGAYQDR